ncbi:BTB_2 domain-containing protein [Meloidogyne graminicola]|uniref:BTB_2 domain-containing protein n=1 Tax=Meloidogyne graminicola TaxID=189291 RepID=A0A8S9ZR48_9BILA|nr:BTB_2 domain-containing protein [Meloidogyne graminicola]
MTSNNTTNNKNNKNKVQLARISSSLGLFTQNQHFIVHRGRSFVNLPPLPRIEQNVLPILLSTRVNSDKFVNYMSSSPPPPIISSSSQSIKEHSHYQKNNSKDDALLQLVEIIQIFTQLFIMRHYRPNNQNEEENTLIDKCIGEETINSKTRNEQIEGCSLSLDVELGQRIRAPSIGTAAIAIERKNVSQHNQLQEKASLKSSLKIEDTILRLNIGGSPYRIRTRSILKHGADTLLGRFIRMDEQHRRAWADAYFEDECEYFFERVPRYFDPVYDFYASGKLHVPKDLCFDKFMAELRFWSVSKAKVDQCCSPFAQYYLYKKTHHLDTPDDELPRFLRRKTWDPERFILFFTNHFSLKIITFFP